MAPAKGACSDRDLFALLAVIHQREDLVAVENCLGIGISLGILVALG